MKPPWVWTRCLGNIQYMRPLRNRPFCTTSSQIPKLSSHESCKIPNLSSRARHPPNFECWRYNFELTWTSWTAWATSWTPPFLILAVLPCGPSWHAPANNPKLSWMLWLLWAFLCKWDCPVAQEWLENGVQDSLGNYLELSLPINVNPWLLNPWFINKGISQKMIIGY